MAKITSFIYCLGADRFQNPEGQAINANGILANISPEFMPGNFSFSVVFTILGLEKKNHNLQIKFTGPDNQILADTNGVPIPFDKITEADPNGELMPEDERGLIMTMDMRNILFRKEGYYSTEILCDGLIIGEYKIYAKGKNRIN